MIGIFPWRMTATHRRELVVGLFGLASLLAAEWALILLVPGTNYSQGDGKMAQAVILTAARFGGIFRTTNLNPLQGFGSQLLPINVWANPAYWPFLLVNPRLATDVSAVIALLCLAVGCYVMARCVDLPALPSLMAAQSVIFLFGPLIRLEQLFYQVFWINPGTATVYSCQLMALGIFIRVNPDRLSRFFYATGAISVFILCSLCLDPLWSMISGLGLLSAFAVAIFGSPRLRIIFLRACVLFCCLLVLTLTGALPYLYSLTQYAARVWYSNTMSYSPIRHLSSVYFTYPRVIWIYGACAMGWILGLVVARNRLRVFVFTGLMSSLAFTGYALAFMFSSHWWLPLPIYVEHSLVPLFLTTAIAGYWAVLRQLAIAVHRRFWFFADRRKDIPAMKARSFALATSLGLFETAAVAAFTLVTPLVAVIYGANSGLRNAEFFVPFPAEPELSEYLGDTVSLRVDGPFRGSVSFIGVQATTVNSWMHNIPTAIEYSQLITPPAAYMAYSFLSSNIGLTGFVLWIGSHGSYEVLLKTLQALGVRLVAVHSNVPAFDERGIPYKTFPRHPMRGEEPTEEQAPNWIVYNLPNPNEGTYSPTQTIISSTGREIAAKVRTSEFDFTKQVVLQDQVAESLVAAREAHLTVIRDGLHVTAHSDGYSLLVLPQQFSHCLRAHDAKVHLMRADLVLTGLVFSGDVDTDISFDYGIFSPWCRFVDIKEVRGLDLHME